MKSIRTVLHFLTTREKFLVLCSIGIRFLLVSLDLVGIFLIGVVVSLLSGTTISPTSPLSLGLRWIETLGFRNAYAVILGGAIAFFILKGVLSFALTYLTAAYVGRIEARKAIQIFSKLLNSKIDQTENLGSEKILHGVTNSINAAFGQTIMTASGIAGEIALLVGVSTYLVLTNVWLFAGFAAFFGLIGLIMQLTIGRLSGRIAEVQNSTFLLSQSTVLGAIANFRQIAFSKRAAGFAVKFAKNRNLTSRSSAKYFSLTTLPRYITEVAVMLGVGMLVLQRSIGGEGAISSTTIAIYLAGIFRIVASMLPLQSGLSSLKRIEHDASIGFEMARKFLLEPAEFTSPINSSKSRGVPRIEFRNVSFSHLNSDKKILHDINFVIEPGSYVAISGKSGVGKSTLADLILGLRDPQSGEILIGRYKPREYFQKHPESFSYVPQKTELIEGSFLENITLIPGETAFNPKHMDIALSAANLTELVSSLPDGLHTRLGPGGRQLSGGQVQRIGLARALYTQPKILVMDEATSSLDSDTEELVSSSLSALAGTITCIVIAHRPATIRAANKKFILEATSFQEMTS